MGVLPVGVKPELTARRLKINYPEDVVLRSSPSTGCRQWCRSQGV